MSEYERLTKPGAAGLKEGLGNICRICHTFGSVAAVGPVAPDDCKNCTQKQKHRRLWTYENIGSPEDLAKAKEGAQTYVCVDCQKVFDFKDVDGDSAEFCPFCGYDTLTDITRLAEKYEQEMTDDKACPCCGATVIHTGGCIQCPDPACGWSSCG